MFNNITRDLMQSEISELARVNASRVIDTQEKQEIWKKKYPYTLYETATGKVYTIEPQGFSNFSTAEASNRSYRKARDYERVYK